MDFLLFTGGVVALIWGAVLFWRGGLLAGATAVLLAGICFGHPFFNVPLGPLPVTLDRVLLGTLLVVALGYRRFGWNAPKPAIAADWTLLAFIAVLTLNTLTHNWHVNNSLPLAHLVFYSLLPLVFYWVVRQIRVTERAIWGLFAALGLFGAYLAMTSIAETHQMWALVYPKYIGSTAFVEFLGRARGPLLNPAGSGILLGLCMAGALMWWPRLNRRSQLLLLGTLPLFGWGIYSTFTRSAWMGGLLGLLVIGAFTLPRALRPAVFAGVLAVGLPLAVANWEHLLAFKRDKDLTAEDVAESAKLRPILAVVAWHMFLDRPWLGCGYGQYFTECRPYLADRTVDLPLEKVRPYVQHNSFLALLTETGLLGMALFVATLVLWIRQAWRLCGARSAPPANRQFGLLFLAFIGVWLPNAMFQDVLIIPMINMLLFFMAALTVNLSLETSGEEIRFRAPARLAIWRPAQAGG